MRKLQSWILGKLSGAAAFLVSSATQPQCCTWALRARIRKVALGQHARLIIKDTEACIHVPLSAPSFGKVPLWFTYMHACH